jgi:opacity protein-like surface antigen
MRRIGLAIIILAGAGAAACQADVPGRVVLAFAAGGAHASNDDERWGGAGTGYGYFGELGYEATSWLVAPVAQWGNAFTSGRVPPWEEGGYAGNPSGVKHKLSTFALGGRVRLPLWRMKLRPYGGGGVAWTRYNRQVLDGVMVLLESESTGSGYAGLAGLEFFPDPARGFSLALEYRYAVTAQEWLRAPTGGKGSAGAEFNLAEQLITVSVKAYTL